MTENALERRSDEGREPLMTNGLALCPLDTAASPLRTAAEILRSTLRRDDGPQVQVALGPTRAWSFEVRRDPIQIEVLEGEVMVTFEGDPVDHVLAKGAVFTAARRGRVAVAAFRPSRFSVTAA